MKKPNQKYFFSDLEYENRIRKLFSRNSLARGVIIFVFLSIVGFTVLFILDQSVISFRSFLELDLKFLLIVLILMVIDLLLGGYRYYYFLNMISHSVRFKTGFNANLADIFMSGITPFQTGGGLAMLYIFKRDGVSLPLGLAVSVISFIMTMIFIFTTSIISFFLINIDYRLQLIGQLVNYSFVIFSLILLLFFFLIWKPEFLSRIVDSVMLFRNKYAKRKNKEIVTDKPKIEVLIAEYHRICIQFLSTGFFALFKGFLITIILFLNKFTLAYFLVRSLNITANYPDIIAIQTLILFIPYFSPTPGGSGVSELTIATLMTAVLPVTKLIIFTFLQKLFLQYFPVLLGFCLVLKILKDHMKLLIEKEGKYVGS